MDVLQEKGLTPLRAILGFSLVSTTLHYTHNVVRAADYPQIPGISVLAAQIIVAFGWVLFTAFGWLGHREYVRKSYPRALAFLLVYSLSGLASADTSSSACRGSRRSGSPRSSPTRRPRSPSGSSSRGPGRPSTG